MILLGNFRYLENSRFRPLWGKEFRSGSMRGNGRPNNSNQHLPQLPAFPPYGKISASLNPVFAPCRTVILLAPIPRWHLAMPLTSLVLARPARILAAPAGQFQSTNRASMPAARLNPLNSPSASSVSSGPFQTRRRTCMRESSWSPTARPALFSNKVFVQSIESWVRTSCRTPVLRSPDKPVNLPGNSNMCWPSPAQKPRAWPCLPPTHSI